MTGHDSIDKSHEPTKGSELTLEPVMSAVKPGETEELREGFNVWSLGALLVCLMATWEALATVVTSALTNGGPPCLFYNYIISFLGTLALAASMAEIASIYPTAGGQYHWVAAFAPHNIRPFASWITGWISIGGQLALTASAALSSGLLFQALLILNNPSYVPQRWHGVMFYWMVLAYSLVINVYGSRILANTNVAAGILHVVGFVIIVVILGVMTKDKNTSEYVFTDFSNTSGWSSNGISWLVGLLSTVYPFLGYDAAAHMSEELPRPSKYVPIAMLGSILINGLMGFIFCIVFLYCLGDLDVLLQTATGFPFVQLYYNVTQNQVAATIMTLFHALTALAANSAGLTSTSRTAWAFARDRAFPFSGYYSHLGHKSQIPVRMCVLLTVLQFLLGLIYIGNTTAFNAILSMSILGMYASYVLPIGFMLWYGRRSGAGPAKGWFSLGRWGSTINTIALLWGALAMLFSMFPSYKPVTPENMNYSSLVLGGWVIGGSVYYVFCQRRVFEGPVMLL
ncbi:hypothetical protein M409DRAFT_15897 [Zasmidium cellare ATCC 36951]|uniref:Amino acid permease/ SLC12A domain-containing protein n=1 Tax=Zasmidium cellare ATCC 36951 TaxID=1080233 RepID=A0A6A6D643_ZASCE|nr:uncharacterized protein M409DRAFT_15897 [Zasmidium cellare ATCC 36951]KAF2173619.1 hypothetical protein M409DRAFT_15897 [Zasmidium cellare ATCC 36951]